MFLDWMRTRCYHKMHAPSTQILFPGIYMIFQSLIMHTFQGMMFQENDYQTKIKYHCATFSTKTNQCYENFDIIRSVLFMSLGCMVELVLVETIQNKHFVFELK